MLSCDVRALLANDDIMDVWPGVTAPYQNNPFRQCDGKHFNFVSKYLITFQLSLPQRLAENRSDSRRPPEEDPQQHPVHEGADEPVAYDHGMTAGGAVPRSGQHSQDHQQQREPPNYPRSDGTRQSRDYRLNLIH